MGTLENTSRYKEEFAFSKLCQRNCRNALIKHCCVHEQVKIIETSKRKDEAPSFNFNMCDSWCGW